MSETIQQGTSEWYTARLGRFTSSEIHSLMTPPKDATAKLSGMLGETAKTYVLNKLAEHLTQWSEEFSNAATEWGTNHEEQARRILEDTKGIRSKECGLLIHETYRYFAGSPDGVIVIDDVLHCIEIKCPYKPKEHLYNILNSFGIDAFKKKLPKYYWQLQSNMLLTGANKGLFITYCPLDGLGDNNFIIREIDRYEDDCAAILDKVQKAYEYMQFEASALGLELNYN